MANRLAGETSPYLLQHAENPVQWQPWGEQALTQARSENKPILLSIGYSACHWCHVMAHESFEDPAVAALMNDLFVNIKVDREERPDLDLIYQSAHQLLAGRPGGWPLTMFLAPDGLPFFGGTYFPKLPRYGLPGFPDLCRQVEHAYRNKPDVVAEQNRSLLAAMAASPSGPAPAGAIDDAPVGRHRDMLLQSFDSRYGGFGGAPKFPHATDLAFLLRRGRQGDGRALEAAVTTLTRMAEGGIYDQLGGGFCRYSVDERWDIPHFEKMLYDNGPLLGLYADAWALTADSLFARVVDATVRWVIEDMQLPAGGFASSLDADSEGEEGRYYVWDADELRGCLSDSEWRAVARHWGLEGPPNFENRHWHLRVAAPLRIEDAALLESARAALREQRRRRVPPGRDDKVLTSWNALMIEGLAHAARVFDRRDWLQSAQRAADYLASQHMRAGRLLATSRRGRAHLAAYLDDHAFLLAAMLELMRAEFRERDLALALSMAELLLRHFEDEGGGFFFTAHDHESLIHRSKNADDNSLPAGNAVAAFALLRLGHLVGEPRYLAAAERSLRSFYPQLRRPAGGGASLILALEEYLLPSTTVILRGPASEVADWAGRLAGRQLAAVVLTLPNGCGRLPAALAKPESPQVNAWVCTGVNCLAPVADIDELRRVLQAA